MRFVYRLTYSKLNDKVVQISVYYGNCNFFEKTAIQFSFEFQVVIFNTKEGGNYIMRIMLSAAPIVIMWKWCPFYWLIGNMFVATIWRHHQGRKSTQWSQMITQNKTLCLCLFFFIYLESTRSTKRVRY